MEMIDVESKINYTFKNPDLLKTALTHISLANEIGCESYERLEFLGDAVLELVVSDYIFEYNHFDSGILTRLRAGLVSTNYLKQISEKLSLDKAVKKSKSLPTISDKTKADLFESVVGAVYLDSGYESAKKIINDLVLIDLENVQNVLKTCFDYKSKLQEEMQKNAKFFRYIVFGQSGLDHEKIFEVGLEIEGQIVIKGTGKSIHIAEEECAKNYFQQNK